MALVDTEGGSESLAIWNWPIMNDPPARAEASLVPGRRGLPNPRPFITGNPHGVRLTSATWGLCVALDKGQVLQRLDYGKSVVLEPNEVGLPLIAG